MKPLRVLAAAVVVAMLAACGGSSSSPSSDVTTFTSSPTPSGPSIAQVASVIAQLKAALAKAETELKDCPAVDDPMSTLGCSLGVDLAQIDAQTAVTRLQALGTVPSEISSLFADTLGRYQQMTKLNAAACDKNANSKTCTGEMIRARFEVSDLTDQLAGWAPYL